MAYPLPAIGPEDAKKPAADGWKSLPVFDPVKRRIMAVVPVVNNAGDVTLKQAGAYKLVAITRFADIATS